MMQPPPPGIGGPSMPPPQVGYTAPRASRATPKPKPKKRSAKDIARVRAVLKAPK